MTRPAHTYRGERRNAAKDAGIPWKTANQYWTNLSTKRAAKKAAAREKAEAEARAKLEAAKAVTPTVTRRRVV